MNLDIKVATEQDVPALAAILTDANKNKAEHEDSSWGEEPFTEQEVETIMGKSDVYVVSNDDEPVGTFALQESDERVWGREASPAYYLHRLALKRDYRGQQLGLNIVKYIEAIVRERGLEVLRLDCDERNTQLCAYYEQQGFVRVDTKELNSKGHSYVAALYEKKLKE